MRPTTRDLADVHEDIEVLAYAHDPNGSPRFNSGFAEIKAIVNKFAWLVSEIKANEQGAAYPSGVKDGYHVLQRGGSPSDLDAKTHDAHVKALRNLLAGWRVAFARMDDEMLNDAMDVGRYPTRSEQAV